MEIIIAKVASNAIIVGISDKNVRSKCRRKYQGYSVVTRQEMQPPLLIRTNLGCDEQVVRMS